MILRLHVLFMSFIIAISPIFIIQNANASTVGGWSMGGGVSKGASVVYEGTKKILVDGKTIIKKGTATVVPLASDVAKTLARGAGGYALVFAVEQLLGGVDWVLDPANNQIVYTVVTDPTDPSDPSVEYFWRNGTKYTCYSASSCKTAVQAYSDSNNRDWTVESCSIVSSGQMHCPLKKYNPTTGALVDTTTEVIPRVANPAYNPEAESQEDRRSIPLSTVADKVISNAESGNADAQAVTRASADAVVQDAVNDKTGTKARPIAQQLESSATRTQEDAEAQAQADTATGTQTQNPDKPNVTDLSLEFPAFCGWAPIVCEAAQVAINFPSTVTEWWTTSTQAISEAWATTKEYFTKEELKEIDTTVDIVAPPELVDEPDAFRWNAYCPFNAHVNDISLNGQSTPLETDFSSWCQMASDIKPFVILCGAWFAFLIATGFRMGNE